MKTVSRSLVGTALFVSLFPMLANAGSVGKAGLTGSAAPVVGQECKKVTNRPLSDFLSQQGTTSALQFFPPAKDYAGWTDSQSNPTIFALIDYAGLANDAITAAGQPSLGTTVTGFVIECALKNPLPNNNKAQITVALFTTKALGFAQSIANIGPGNPKSFGAEAQQVINGAPASVGPATLVTTFSIPNPGDKLPDLVDVYGNNNPPYNPIINAPITLRFASTTFGRCNGRKALLTVLEEASSDNTGVLNFSVETVKAVDSTGQACTSTP